MPVQQVPNLIQGVTQQAPQQARAEQCKVQLDCINSPADGAMPRPHANLAAVLPGQNWDGCYFYEIDRGDEHYLAGLKNNFLRVIDLNDGTLCTVNTVGAAGSYLATSLDPALSFSAQAVDDYSFIANRTKLPAYTSAVAPSRPPEALIFVKAGAYSTNFQIDITLAGTTYTARYTSDNNSNADKEKLIATDFIAKSLSSLMQGVVPTPILSESYYTTFTGAEGFLFQRSGSSVRVWRNDGQDFTIASSDGQGDDYLKVFKDTARSLSDLPKRGFNGFVLKIRGADRTTDDDYYVEFQGPSSTGFWEERAGPGVSTTLDPATMPHVLVNTAPQTFDFKQQAWSTRIAGDTETAKDPSFVGKGIQDVFFHQGRLGILTNSSAVWSKTNFPFTFFPDTVQTLLDTAPVDIKIPASGTSKGPSLLEKAVSVDEGLYLWAQRTQSRITSGADPFKSTTVQNFPSTSYEFSSELDPVSIGRILYFVTESGPYATLRAIPFAGGKSEGDIDVTAHVSQYIPAGCRVLATSDTLRMIFVQTKGDPDALYLYNYLISGQEYIQSAWNKWRIPGGNILWAGIKGSTLNVLQQRGSSLALLKFNLTSQAVDADPGATYATRLDLRVTEAGVTGLAFSGGQTTFTLPYVPTGPELKVVTRQDQVGGYTRGREFEVVSVVGQVVTVKGDLTPYLFYVGQVIDSRRTFNTFYLKDSQGTPILANRLTVKSISIALAKAGYTRVEAVKGNGQKFSAQFNGRTLSSSTGTTGSPRISDTILKVGVGAINTDVEVTLINDTWLPAQWQSAQWEFEAENESAAVGRR